MVLCRVAVDPVEQVGNVGARVGGGAGGFMPDTEKHLDAHPLQHVGCRNGAFRLGEMDARLVAVAGEAHHLDNLRAPALAEET